MFNLCKPARWVDKLYLSISLLNQKTEIEEESPNPWYVLVHFLAGMGLEHVMVVSPSLRGLRSPRFLTDSATGEITDSWWGQQVIWILGQRTKEKTATFSVRVHANSVCQCRNKIVT